MVLDEVCLARYRRPRSGAALSSGQHGPRSGHGGLQQHAYRPRTPECISRIAIGSVRMTPPHSHRHTYTHARVRFHRMASRFSPPRSVPRPAHQKPFFLPGSAITRPVTHCTLWTSGGKTRALRGAPVRRRRPRGLIKSSPGALPGVRSRTRALRRPAPPPPWEPRPAAPAAFAWHRGACL